MNLTHRKIQSELRYFIKVNTCHGLILYMMEMAIYIALICGVLFLPYLWMKILASVLAGIKMANLATLAHDAAHNSLTKSVKLNKFIAVTAFLPCLFNYRLWLYDHHVLHHARTNENFRDSYTPFSKEEYDDLSQTRRWFERLYRKPSVLFFGLYYILERWRKVKLCPRNNMPKAVYRPAWHHFGLIMVYFMSYTILLVLAPAYSNTGATTAVVLGFILPFYIFQSLFAFTVYVQHTHERVAWFNSPPDREGNGRQEYISVNLVFPDWLSLMMHHVYTHPAHHVCPAIPCYQLKPAQAHLDKLLEGHGVTEKFSFSWLFQTMDNCKLYDYENHCWLDFNGRPTTGTTLVSEEIKYANAA